MSNYREIQPNFYYLYFDREGVTNEWHLVNSPLPMACALTFYLTFVLYVGPRYMENRPPFQVQGLMKMYNVLQMAYNVWMLHLILSSTEALAYLMDRSCHPENPTDNFRLRYIFLLHTWHYFCSKFLDLLDTFILVLRKKYTHITYLHLYHHSIMVFLVWFSMKNLKAQQITAPTLLNNFVHVIMYSYYFLACFGQKVQKYLWWKRYLTRLQLVQFAVVIIYLSYLYINECEVSQTFKIIWIANVSIIAAFFINFYFQNYIKTSKRTFKKQV